MKAVGIPRRTVQDWEKGVMVPPDYVQRLVLEEMARIAGK
nr:MAG TPA: centromere-binding protein [Bacteriophage sp.]